MGCISSKLLPPGDARRLDHVVSLTSTTYGALDLGRNPNDKNRNQETELQAAQQDKPISKEWKRTSPPPLLLPLPQKPAAAATAKLPETGLEVINAWEIMAGLEDDAPVWSPMKRPGRLWSPAKVIGMASPKKSAARRRNPAGKENSPLQRCSAKAGDADADRVLRTFKSWDNSKLAVPPNSASSKKCTPASAKIQKAGTAEAGVASSRRSLSPLFDPELLASIERELSEEGEQVKKMAASEQAKHKCPPGGENAVVLYTTTLRGIRRTFEECNAVRAAIESHDVKIAERDVSMDSGYREELRRLLASKEVRVPAVFVRGRHVGGAKEVLKLEEEGKLGALFEGMPRARVWCAGCAGVRFVVCRDCNGSCKVLDGEHKKTVKCGECNENGLVRCPICSS